MITKHNLYSFMIKISQPQIARFVLIAFVLLASSLRVGSVSTLNCDLSCGGHVGG